MTWSASIPNASQSPGLFPAQAQDNWGRLQAIITADHLFSTSTSSDEGYHKVVHWINQADPTYMNGVGMTYAKDALQKINSVDQTAPQLFNRTSDGTTNRENPITCVPIRAYVVFDGTVAGSGATQTIRSSYNVDSVTRSGSGDGRYIVNFTAGTIPSDTYAMSITGMQAGTNSSCVGYVNGDAAYTTSITTTTLSIRFENLSSTNKDVVMGCVMIYGG